MTVGGRSWIRTHSYQLFLIALLLRIAVFLTASSLYHIPLSSYAAKGDGASYLAYAKAILGDPSALTDYDRRVFPGYPALIALVHLSRLSLPMSAVLIDWFSAGIAAVAACALFGDKRTGYAMLFLVPHYLCNSSLAMSEAPLLAFTLTGLLLVHRNHPIAGGLLLGAAGLIRPMACFAAGAWMIHLLVDRRWRQSLKFALPALVVVAIGLLIMHRFTGNAFRGVKIYRDSPQAYVGRIFELPFHSLLTTPRREHASMGFITYIYIHVAVVLFACASLGSRIANLLIGRSSAGTQGQSGDWCSRKSRHPLALFAFLWLIANTLFQLCIGSGWGFRHFPRFAIPSQPALFFALLPYAPQRKWIWISGGIGVFVLAVVSVGQCP